MGAEHPTTHVNTIRNKSNKGIRYVSNAKMAMKRDGGWEMQYKRNIFFH